MTPLPVGPAIETVVVTTWPSTTVATGGRLERLTLQELGELLRKWSNHVGPKVSLPLMAFATTADGRRRKGSVTGISALALDYDEGRLGYDEAVDRLGPLGVAAVVYETPSSSLERPRWRVVLPLAREWTEPPSWQAAYSLGRERLESLVGVAFDRTTSDPCRGFYPPARPDVGVPPRRVVTLDGPGFDLAGLVASSPTRPTLDRPQSRVPGPSGGDPAVRSWAREGLDRECSAVASAPRGNRNVGLNLAAFKVGQLVGAGLLERHESVDHLARAAEACGLVQDDGAPAACATIRSGLDAGEQEPRWPVPRPPRHEVDRPPPPDEDDASPPSDDDAPPEGLGDRDAHRELEGLPTASRPHPVRDAVGTMTDRLAACDLAAVGGRAVPWLLRTARGEEKPVPVPWPSLARELGGGFGRGAHLLIGNPKSGKSQFVLEAARHAAAAGHPVAYIALELDEEQVFARTLALEAGTLWSRLVLGELPPEEVLRLTTEHVPAVSELPVHVLGADARTWPVAELSIIPEALARLHPEAKGRRPLVVLDYLQIVGGEERELRERIGAAAYAARIAARRSGAAVLLVSSTARDGYGLLDRAAATKAQRKAQEGQGPLGEGSPIRFLAMGKESGEVEYAADSVAVLVRDPDRVPGAQARHRIPFGRANRASTVWVAMAATRARPDRATGWASLAFDGSRFYDDPAPEPIGSIPSRRFDAARGF